MKLALKFSVLFFLFSCQNQNTDNQQIAKQNLNPVIYGEDNRFDFSEITDLSVRELARSTVALISNEHLVYDNVFDSFHLEKADLGLTMCSQEKYLRQPLYAHCSGSLIAPDVILTAGHCIRDQRLCKDTKFAFDYTLFDSNVALNSLPAKNVFACAEIIYLSEIKTAADFALVRLDRVVTDRKPLKLSETGLSYQDQLMMIGHPAGLPTKFTVNGKVRSLMNAAYIVASIDSYSGNSGSSVFNQKTHEIIGVLVRGENDYERQNGCYVSKKCTEDGCRGEEITRVSEIKKYLPKN